MITIGSRSLAGAWRRALTLLNWKKFGVVVPFFRCKMDKLELDSFTWNHLNDGFFFNDINKQFTLQESLRRERSGFVVDKAFGVNVLQVMFLLFLGTEFQLRIIW